MGICQAGRRSRTVGTRSRWVIGRSRRTAMVEGNRREGRRRTRHPSAEACRSGCSRRNRRDGRCLRVSGRGCHGDGCFSCDDPCLKHRHN